MRQRDVVVKTDYILCARALNINLKSLENFPSRFKVVSDCQPNTGEVSLPQCDSMVAGSSSRKDIFQTIIN